VTLLVTSIEEWRDFPRAGNREAEPIDR